MGPKRDPEAHKRPKIVVNPTIPYSISSPSGRIRFLAPCNCVVSEFQIHLSRRDEVTITFREGEPMTLELEGGNNVLEYDPMKLEKRTLVSIITGSDTNHAVIAFLLKVS